MDFDIIRQNALALRRSERLQLLQYILNSFVDKRGGEVESELSASERRLLKARLKQVQEDPTGGESYEIVLSRIRRKLKNKNETPDSRLVKGGKRNRSRSQVVSGAKNGLETKVPA